MKANRLLVLQRLTVYTMTSAAACCPFLLDNLICRAQYIVQRHLGVHTCMSEQTHKGRQLN